MLTKNQVTSMSEIICDSVEHLDIFDVSENICLYMPIKNEVDVTLMFEKIWGLGKKLWLPKVIGEKMCFVLYEKGSRLAHGAYNIKEPVSDITLYADSNTLVVMPGAVFSVEHNRIGYGGGYYDRFLSACNSCHSIAVCYGFQVLDKIPFEEHDIKPELIVTESCII